MHFKVKSLFRNETAEKNTKKQANNCSALGQDILECHHLQILIRSGERTCMESR